MNKLELSSSKTEKSFDKSFLSGKNMKLSNSRDNSANNKEKNNQFNKTKNSNKKSNWANNTNIYNTNVI